MRAALLSAALLLASGVRAETFGDAPPPPSADLDQSWAWASAQAESLQVQQEQIYQLRQQYRQILGSALPNLTFNAQERWQDTSGVSGGGFFFESPQPQVNFALSQPIFAGLREYAEMSSLKKQGQAAELQLKRARAVLYQAVANSFYLTLNLEAQLANNKLALDLSDTRLKELRRFEELGKSRHSEVTLLESQDASLAAQTETLRGQIDAARSVLSFLTGKEMSATQLVDKLERLRQLGPEEEPLGRAYQRSDIQALRKLVESQQAQVRVAKGAFLPTVTFLGNAYVKRNTTLDPVKWDATITGSVPLFEGGAQLAAVNQADSQLKAAQFNLEAGVRQARSDIHTAYTALRSAVAGAEAAERAYLKADETYKTETKEYRLGLVNNLDVLTAMNSLIAAKNAFDQILVTAKVDLVALKISDEEILP